MNKPKLHHLWRILRPLQPIYLVILALVLGIVAVTALRANNEHMVKLRADVYSADKADGNVSQALNNLQSYVTAHMNTNLTDGNTSVYPPIQLEYTYARLVQAQGDQLQAANAQLYTDAQGYCEQQDPTDFSGHNRVPCIEQYVTSHGEQALPAIPVSLYQFDFISPRWSPDLAGSSLALTVLSGLGAVVLFIVRYIVRKAAR